MKKVIIFIVLFVSVFKTYSQVNLQSGSAIYSLPMFNWQDDKSRLNLAVSLNYNSGSGLKTDEAASRVGQGWSLMAGGVITRVQVGEPDDQKAYYNNNYNGSNTGEAVEDITKYPAGYLYNSQYAPQSVYIPNDAALGCPKAMATYPIFGDRNHVYKQNNTVAADRELDHFSFQFNGRSGMFVLDGRFPGQVVMLEDSRLIVTYQQTDMTSSMLDNGARTTISSFTIQDETGLIYKFQNLGTAKTLTTSYCSSDLQQSWTQPKFKHSQVYHQASFDNHNLANPYVVNSWYLTEIDDALVTPNSGRSIHLYYNPPINIISIAGGDISYNQTDDYSVITHKTSNIRTQILDRIEFPDLHVVHFTYNSADRVDMKGDKALNSVEIKYNGRYLSEYKLNTSYFILNRYGTPITDFQKSVARLCLMSVKKIGVDLAGDSPPYRFDYYLGSGIGDDFVPPPYFPLKDIWGFYNGSYDPNNPTNGGSKGANTTTYIPSGNTPVSQVTLASLSNDQTIGLCFLRAGQNGITYTNVKPGLAQNGLLKQIIYPTGGTITYQYAQNTGTVNSQVISVGGVHVSSTAVTDGGFSNPCSTAVNTNYKYVLDGSTNSSLWGLETPLNIMMTTSHYKAELKKHINFGLKCPYGFQYPGILSRSDAVDISGFQQFMESIGTIMDIVGVVSQVMDVISIVGGVTTMGIISIVADVLSDLFSLFATCVADTAKTYYTTMYYNYDLNGSNPLPTQFKRVEVVQSSGNIGKTVQEFTSSDDYDIWEKTNSALSMKQRYAYWAYGLPKTTTVYDVAGNIVKQTINIYDTSLAKTLPNVKAIQPFYVNPSCRCEVIYSHSQRNPYWADPASYSNPSTYIVNSNSDITLELYDVYTGHMHNSATYERTYETNGDVSQYAQTVTTYTYNDNVKFRISPYDPYIGNVNYQVNTIATTQSNGDINYKTIKYTSDYTSGILATLAQKNIVNLPVETASYVVRNNSTTNLYLGEKVTEFTTLANGDIKPSRILEQRFGQPQSSFTAYYGPGSTSNPSYIQTQAFTYDANSNLTGMQDEGLHSVTNIYDYNDKYIVGSVINADPNNDKPAYTSFEVAGSFGGWVLTGSASYVNTASITGSNCFSLSGNTLKASSLNTGKPYKLTFWSTGTVSISGGTTSLVTSVPGVNGFTYYEYNVAQGTSYISVTGSGNIDELRLYPKAARMRTVTYDPLIGKTSECDENNRATYYTYDELGRLRTIQDENRNVLKMYEYNNTTKINGCPGTYYNQLITEAFIRNNCAADYLGGLATYSVPANKYSSTISQQDADIQAENELFASGQTYANTNGACLFIYKNVAKSETDNSEGCPVGSVGGAVTYTVPAGTYSSVISQDDADQKAQDDVDANAPTYINLPAHRVCTVSTDPDWTATTETYSCQLSGGNNTGDQLQQFTDLNPNSSTYNQTQWYDIGQNTTACPIPGSQVVLVYNMNNPSGLTNARIDVGHYDANQNFTIVGSGTAAFPITTNSVTVAVPSGTYDIRLTLDFQPGTTAKPHIVVSPSGEVGGTFIFGQPYPIHNVNVPGSSTITVTLY